MTDWRVGASILDEYTVEKELGRGGMGRVWLVRSQSTGRPFAVKQALIRDKKHRRAFLTELQTWIDLPEHPNIVPCRFFRTVGDEIVIFADYVEGGSLADWIAKGKLTGVEQILDMAIQFAWGLHAIHERGLIHQDVKPGNVLMTPEGVPMVTDFGLARARLRAGDGSLVSPALPPGEQSVLVSAGGMTPAYASPEQRAGQSLSRKTDIWSWGVSLLDMFMGGVSCPHGGHIAADVLEACVEDDQGDFMVAPMPRQVAEVLRRCFTKNIPERWDSARECSASMVRAYADVTGTPYARAQHGSLPGQKLVNEHDRRIKNAQWRDPRLWLREAYRAVGRDPADAAHFQARRAVSRRGSSVGDLAIYFEVEQLLISVIGPDDELNGNLLASFYADKALLCFALDDANAALAAADRCIAIRECLVHTRKCWKFANDLASAYMHKAMFVRQMGDQDASLGLYDKCIAIQRRLVEEDGRIDLVADLARAYMNKACDLTARGDVRSALALFDRSIAALQMGTENGQASLVDDDLAHVYMNKAGALLRIGNARGAAEAYDACVRIRAPLVEREGRSDLANDLADALMGQALAANGLGETERAIEIYDRCIRIRKKLVESEGRHDLAADLAHAYVNKANAMCGLGPISEAAEVYDTAISIYAHLVEREGRTDLASSLENARMCKARAGSGRTSDRVELPSGLCLRVSSNAIVDLTEHDDWFRCPGGHFWLRTPNLSMKSPPYTPEDEIVFDCMSAPVPTSRAEATEYVHVYVEHPSAGAYWRGDWMSDFHVSYELSRSDRAAWRAWVKQSGQFLDGVIALASKQADLAARKGEQPKAGEGIYGEGIVSQEVPKRDVGLNPVLYSLSQRLNSSHRLPSAIQQLDYEMACEVVGSDVEKKGMRIVAAERDRSAPCSIVAEGPGKKVAVKVVVARAPHEVLLPEDQARVLKAFAREHGLTSAIAPVGLMTGAERRPDGQQGFYVKYEGLVEI